VKASERAHQHHAHQKNAQSRNTDMFRGTQITVASSADERMAASQVEQSHSTLRCCTGQSLSVNRCPIPLDDSWL